MIEAAKEILKQAECYDSPGRSWAKQPGFPEFSITGKFSQELQKMEAFPFFPITRGGRPRPFTPYAAPKPHIAPPNRIWRCWLTCTKASSSPWCLTYKNLSFFHWGENFVLVSFFIIFLEKLAKTIDFLKKIWYNKL